MRKLDFQLFHTLSSQTHCVLSQDGSLSWLAAKKKICFPNYLHFSSRRNKDYFLYIFDSRSEFVPRERGHSKCWQPGYFSTFRDKEERPRWQARAPLYIIIGFYLDDLLPLLPPRKNGSDAGREQSGEIAGWEAKAFTDPLKICKRKPSSGVMCEKYNSRWESIPSFIHNISAGCF